VSWQIAWSISTFYSIQARKQHCFKNGVLFHSKSGEIFEISTQYDDIPQMEVIYTNEIEYKALFSISQRTDHVAALDRLDRLCIFELPTGKLTAKLSLKHHGEGKIKYGLIQKENLEEQLLSTKHIVHVIKSIYICMIYLFLLF